jgi:hypothetical protein
MTSQPVRDPLADHLITPQNSVSMIVLTDRLLKDSAGVGAPA